MRLKPNEPAEPGKVVKFPGQAGYRKHGINYTVVNKDGWIACDQERMVWAFRKKSTAQIYLASGHRPLFWLNP